MATINGSTASSYWTFKIEVTENSVDAINNTSNVTVSAYIGRKSTSGSSYMQGAKIPCTINISSNAYNDSASFTYSNSNRVDIAAGGWLKIGSKTFSSVKHNSDGSGTITISASFTNNISPASGSASGNFVLTKIARTSSVSMSGGTIGSTATITITSASPDYWHLLEYEFYEASGSIVELGEGVNSYNWKIPSSLADQIPNSTSGTGILRCITYNGETEIGQTEISMQLSVLNVPTISDEDYIISIDESSKYSDWGIYLSGYSKAKITAKATAYDGASISNFTIFIGGIGSVTVEPTGENKNELSYVTDIFTTGGTKTIGINATDSRGLPSSRYKKSIDVYQCVSPSIKTFTVSRKDDNQSQVVIKCNWDYDSINGKNATVGKVYYKEGKNGSYTTEPIEVTKGSELILEDIEFDATKSYYFKLIVTDLLEQRDEKEAFISTREVLMDFRAGGKGFSIGKISEADIFEVEMDSKFNKEVEFKEQVIEEYGHYAHYTTAGWGNKGYTRIAKLIVNSAWNDAYLVFNVIQRHKTFSTYYVSFKHVDHADPDIDIFTYEGDMPGYLVKVGEGEWDLIVEKKEGNDCICVTDFKNNPYTNGKTEVKWLSEYNSELPEGAIVSKKRNGAKELWTGAAYMNGDQTAKLNYLISSQERGIVLVFSQWDYLKESNPSEALKNDNFVSHFVPKEIVSAFPGKGHTFPLVASNYSSIATKYLKIYDDKIEGDASNVSNGNIGTSGISYNNNTYVLVRIYGV